MKVYYTPTQEDYDDLMAQLKPFGYHWEDGTGLLYKNHWLDYKENTNVILNENKSVSVDDTGVKGVRTYPYTIEKKPILSKGFHYLTRDHNLGTVFAHRNKPYFNKELNFWVSDGPTYYVSDPYHFYGFVEKSETDYFFIENSLPSPGKISYTMGNPIKKELHKMKFYFANDLFNEATQDYNEKIARRLEETFGEELSLYVPQRNEAINDKDAYADAQMIANADYEELEDSDALIAVLDTQDFGVGLEIGIMYQQGKPIIGIYTDVRQKGADNPKKIAALSQVGQNQFAYVNLMATGLILNNGYLVTNTDDLLKAVADLLEENR